MTALLALTLAHHHMETPASYVARLSRRNLSVPREFCSDLGLRWPHICSAHPDQLERLSQLAGVMALMGAGSKTTSSPFGSHWARRETFGNTSMATAIRQMSGI
ncbi:hypothetical protein [Ruegeria denitrificans]|uniref:hypothetical protein n=1 Tax=Ruegeria denitrificans TaxID=1715692 RepID=UPI001A9476A5|nr:hypothetical protein [Ruegeria denitrificans]